MSQKKRTLGVLGMVGAGVLALGLAGCASGSTDSGEAMGERYSTRSQTACPAGMPPGSAITNARCE